MISKDIMLIIFIRSCACSFFSSSHSVQLFCVMGNTMLRVPSIGSNALLQVPDGCYFIATANHSQPNKQLNGARPKTKQVVFQ
ncbi:Uncharacterized protein APZ42_016901 [Daphnia magna]|uniref:Uncharacterized protein n=1 Tax=Daphnia magna TaxID=35525 RepID=A0A0P6C9K5_9CRUS|nr:Uncharacterized protein APZ42_016901 [Daphnia magna]